jgi:hypothetical protein
MAERSTVVGVFADQKQAEQAIQALKQAKFGNDQIGFLVRHSGGILGGIVGGVMGAADAVLLPAFGPTDASAALESTLPLSEEAIERLQLRHTHKPAGEESVPAEEQSQAGEATVSPDEMRSAAQAQESAEKPENGAGEEDIISPTEVRIGEGEGIVSGGIVGGLLGAAAALLIPGIGPAVAGGILVTALGGAAIGAVTGGLLGVFADMGIPEEEAHHYRRELAAGRTLVTVQVEEGRAQEALDILRRNGATTVK